MDLLAVREMADGRIYSAKQAFELGLVDQIGTKEDALLLMSQNYNLWDCAIVDIVYRDTSFWGNILRGVRLPDLLSSNTGGDVSALLEVVKGNNKFPISYQCELMMY
jgi:protease-4